MTFSLLLNDANDFEGGGTFFEEDGRVYRPQQGVAVLHSGKRRHGGYPISSGPPHQTPSNAHPPLCLRHPTQACAAVLNVVTSKPGLASCHAPPKKPRTLVYSPFFTLECLCKRVSHASAPYFCFHFSGQLLALLASRDARIPRPSRAAECTRGGGLHSNTLPPHLLILTCLPAIPPHPPLHLQVCATSSSAFAFADPASCATSCCARRGGVGGSGPLLGT